MWDVWDSSHTDFVACGTSTHSSHTDFGPVVCRPMQLFNIYIFISPIITVISFSFHVKLLTKDITVLQTEERHCLMQVLGTVEGGKGSHTLENV